MTTELPLFEVNAFTNKRFSGNPAAVCPLSSWLPDELLQTIGAELNLSETAFFVPRADGSFDLRWFTPAIEVALCGHATLASAFVLFERLAPSRSEVTFHTKSGPLHVKKLGERLALNFPGRESHRAEPSAALREALGATPKEIWQSRETVALFESAEEVRALRPDFTQIGALDTYAVLCTAPGTGADADVDFVSRFFAPRVGINEDPVTGSAHCTLIPLWAKKLQKNTLRARQVSKRTGDLWCENLGDRVQMAGNAVLVWEGKLFL